VLATTAITMIRTRVAPPPKKRMAVRFPSAAWKRAVRDPRRGVTVGRVDPARFRTSGGTHFAHQLPSPWWKARPFSKSGPRSIDWQPAQ
jgi:hypothetical protein